MVDRRDVFGRSSAAAAGTAVAMFLIALVLIGCGGGTPEEGASDLTYSPNPFYDDLDRMDVSFKTTGPAREGFEYIVGLSITGPDVDLEECAAYALSSDDRFVEVRQATIVGEPGRTYSVTFKATGVIPQYDTDYFCHGRATLLVNSVSIANPSKETSRTLTTLEFRVESAP